MIGELMALLLSAVVALLFYRWVDRRHKVLLGKILVGLVVVVGLVIVGVVLDEARRARAHEGRLRSVGVELVPPPSAIETAVQIARRRLAGDSLGVDPPSVTFAICNRGTRVVERVVFYPQTFRSGRSTPSPVGFASTREGSNRFESDYILAPGACTSLTWDGLFRVYDSTVARVTEVSTR